MTQALRSRSRQSSVSPAVCPIYPIRNAARAIGLFGFIKFAATAISSAETEFCCILPFNEVRLRLFSCLSTA